MYAGFALEQLDDEHAVFVGRLPEQLLPLQPVFEALWNLHPADYHEIMMHGRLVKTPRWQQAYGKDYHYTQRTNQAMPVPEKLRPFLDWAQEAIDPRLNGLLLNWYEGQLGHYIGKHRDSTTNMVEGAPIVTISLGEERLFRLRKYRGAEVRDIRADAGAVFIMPYATNLAWTHEVPHFKRYTGRRVSVTLRAFE